MNDPVTEQDMNVIMQYLTNECATFDLRVFVCHSPGNTTMLAQRRQNRLPNVGGRRWPNVILTVGPTFKNQRCAMFCQRCQRSTRDVANVVTTLN